MESKKIETYYAIKDKNNHYLQDISQGYSYWNSWICAAKIYKSYFDCQQDRDMFYKDTYIVCINMLEDIVDK